MIAVIVQARMSSTRFPGKVLTPICGKPMLLHVLERCSHIAGVDKVICATSNSPEEEPIHQLCDAHHFQYFAGGWVKDVLTRYYMAAKSVRADTIIRITSDCPLIDPEMCSRVLSLYWSKGKQFCSNDWPVVTFPNGQGVEIFTWEALENAHLRAWKDYDREHVAPWIQQHCGYALLTNDKDESYINHEVNHPSDIARIEQIMERQREHS